MKWILAAALLCASRLAAADICAVRINTTEDMRFEQENVHLSTGCTEVEVTFVNSGTSPLVDMKHDWVLTRSDDVAAVAKAGLRAGSKLDYQASDDTRIVAATKLVAGGESAVVRFSTALLVPEAKYSFFCSVPGHFIRMQGDLEFQQDEQQSAAALLQSPQGINR